MIGQVLYLEAEAAGIRSTSIGCYFDHPMHRVLGLQDLTSIITDMRELDAHQQLLVRKDEKRKDGTVHVTFENQLRARRVARLSCFSCPRS